MRAGAVLEGLAAGADVHLLVIPVAGSAGPPGEEIRRWCARVAVYDVRRHVDPLFALSARVKDPSERLAALLTYPRPALCRFATRAAVREAAALVQPLRHQRVHVFRLYLAPFAEPHLRAGPGGRPACHLDLDDREVTVQLRLAERLRLTGDEAGAQLALVEADRYARLESEWLPRCDQVYVSSEVDRRALARDHPAARVAVLPNTIRVPDTAATPPVRGPFTFLFVGNLGYRPNEDAMRFFCSEILPALRGAAARPFLVHVVGANPSAPVRSLALEPEVRVVGWVDDVAPWYRAAHAAIVPLRAGGGTRIKILEAFAHGCPVVSTTLGAEGLAVTDGRHLYLADTPRDFAAACLRLMRDPALGRSLAQHGLALVRRRHGIGRLRALLRAVPAAGTSE
jgi:glycosyltransferase involved in cell wall biosynthesis